MAHRLKSFWRGEVPLPEVFWHYAVGYGLVLNIATSILFIPLAKMDLSPWLLVPAYFLPAPYNLFMIVVVWRSAGHYRGPKHWAELARICTVIGMLILTAT